MGNALDCTGKICTDEKWKNQHHLMNMQKSSENLNQCATPPIESQRDEILSIKLPIESEIKIETSVDSPPPDSCRDLEYHRIVATLRTPPPQRSATSPLVLRNIMPPLIS